MVETNAWGGKKRKVSESITNPEFFRDPSRTLGRILGRDFVAETGLMYLHRIGLMSGLGFCLPYGGVSRDINYVKITFNKGGWDMFFGKVRMGAHFAEENIEEVVTVKRVPSARVREVYDRETIDQ